MDQIDRTDIHARKFDVRVVLHQQLMLLDIAYRTSRLLGFHIPPERATEIDEVYGELKRRCFWSCWIMGCISQDNTSFKGRSWQSVVGLAFPSDEESFANGEPNSTQAFSKEGTVVSLTESRLSPQLSIMGELVKLYGLWWVFDKKLSNLLTENEVGNSTFRQSTELDDGAKQNCNAVDFGRAIGVICPEPTSRFSRPISTILVSLKDWPL